MKTYSFHSFVSLSILAFLACVSAVFAGEKVNVAEDDSTQSGVYGGGWNDKSDGGVGFGPWVLRTGGNDAPETHAGFFIASTDDHSDLNAVALEGRAFGIFANGVGFEAACAFRSFEQPMVVGDTFSIALEHGRIEKKFEVDSERPGSLGFVLRAGGKADGWNDVTAGARLEFGVYEGEDTYRVFDGGSDHDTGVAVSDAGIAVSVTLTSADTYDLEITTLGDGETRTISGRKLGGESGAPIEGIAVFNRDGEKNDFYFNSLRVTRSSQVGSH